MGPALPQGQPAGTTTLPSPSPAPGTRLRGLQILGEKARRGRPGSKAPLRGRPRAHTQLRMPPSPGPGSFGVQPGPPQQRAAVPGRGRRVSSAASSAPRPAIPGDAHPPRPRAGPLIVSLAGSRARGGGAGGAVGGGAGGGRDRARGPTCPCRAGQWAPGVRKDRHIWTCSGAARAAGPRARPAPLKYGRGRPWSISLAAAGSRSASSRRSSARSSASYVPLPPPVSDEACVAWPGIRAPAPFRRPASRSWLRRPGRADAGNKGWPGGVGWVSWDAPRRVHGGFSGGAVGGGGRAGPGPGRSTESPRPCLRGTTLLGALHKRRTRL